MINNIQQRVERSIFEALRKLIVENGYLPDITDISKFPTAGGSFTQQAQINWDNELKTIKDNKGWVVEIFGTSSAFAKGLKKSPRIVIIPKRIIPGEIGLPPGFNYNNANDSENPGDYKRVLYGDESSNFHFDIHLISSSQVQSRFLNLVLSTALGRKKYISFEDNTQERFFIKHYGYYDVSDSNDGIEENVYSYEVQDLYLFEDSQGIIIKPIIEITTNIILGYTLNSNDEPVPDNPNNPKTELRIT